MKWQNIDEKKLGKVVRKLSLDLAQTKGRGPHPVFWYCIDGKKILRITLPNEHGGSTGLSTGFLKQIRDDFKLDFSQFGDLVECPLKPEEYEQIIREKFNLK